MMARGGDLDQRRDPERACDPRIDAGCELATGHELKASPAIGRNVCVHCGKPWSDDLLAGACVRRPAPLVVMR